MTTATPFRTRLENAVNARHSRLNPFTEKWVNGELTRGQLASWVCQHYQYVSQFPRWCATIYGNCPDADARDFLLENIIEEESRDQARRPPHPLRRGVRGQPRRRRGHAPAGKHPRAHRVVLRDFQTALPHRGGGAAGGPGIRRYPASTSAISLR